MSFDLRFVSRHGKPAPTMSALAKWAASQPHVNAETAGENGTLAYANPETGVYFTLHRSPEALDLNINYCRPTFFALETSAVMGTFVKDFSLLVNAPNDATQPAEYDASALIAWWKEGNRFGCAALRSAHQDFPWMGEAKATNLWRYLEARPRIKEKYDDYFMPDVLVVQLDNRLVRGAHLTRPTWYVMPPVDVFWLENQNIVWADRVLGVLKPYLTKLPGFDWLDVVHEDTLLDTDAMEVWESMYDSLTPNFTMSQIKDSALAMDGFVDVEP
jgi:hypothetical protein